MILSFFHDIGHTFAKTTPTSIFLPGFQWNILGDSINNNFNWNPVVLKKLLKPLKITIFDPTCAKIESPWAMPQTENNFVLAEKTKPD